MISNKNVVAITTVAAMEAGAVRMLKQVKGDTQLVWSHEQDEDGSVQQNASNKEQQLQALFKDLSNQAQELGISKTPEHFWREVLEKKIRKREEELHEKSNKKGDEISKWCVKFQRLRRELMIEGKLKAGIYAASISERTWKDWMDKKKRWHEWVAEGEKTDDQITAEWYKVWLWVIEQDFQRPVNEKLDHLKETCGSDHSQMYEGWKKDWDQLCEKKNASEERGTFLTKLTLLVTALETMDINDLVGFSYRTDMNDFIEHVEISKCNTMKRPNYC